MLLAAFGPPVPLRGARSGTLPGETAFRPPVPLRATRPWNPPGDIATVANSQPLLKIFAGLWSTLLGHSSLRVDRAGNVKGTQDG